MRKVFLAIVILCCLPFIAKGQTHPFIDGPMQLWIYCPTNLMVDANVQKLRQLWTRAAAAGYTHVLLADSKFGRLHADGALPAKYFDNVRQVKRIAAECGLTLVPSLFDVGYSESLLFNDPNLAEGLPVKEAVFVVHDGQAKLVADPAAALKAKWDWKDDSVKMLDDHTAQVRDNPGNARMVQKITLTPYRCYHVWVDIKTDHYLGEPEIKVLVGNKSLNFTQLGTDSTQDWKTHHIVFNSLDNPQAMIYFGVWGQAKGTLMWRNWKLQECGPVNLLRRPGAPLVVEGYVEGKDFERVADPLLGNIQWPGDYNVWHQPPVIKTGLAEGTRLRVSWYHTLVIHQEQVTICPSEPASMELLQQQARAVKKYFDTSNYLMAFDEIRMLNQDESCRSRHLTAGQILADAVRRCAAFLPPDATVYVWSDMFDPHHNARDQYYLVRGDMAGSWEGLKSRIVIMNWNFDKREQSLKFFADRGHRQVLAGFYDGPMENVARWLDSAAKVAGVQGMMYTTWAGDYSKIEQFANNVRQAEVRLKAR